MYNWKQHYTINKKNGYSREMISKIKLMNKEKKLNI